MRHSTILRESLRRIADAGGCEFVCNFIRAQRDLGEPHERERLVDIIQAAILAQARQHDDEATEPTWGVLAQLSGWISLDDLFSGERGSDTKFHKLRQQWMLALAERLAKEESDATE